MVAVLKMFMSHAEFSALNHLKPFVSAEDQAQAVTDLIYRNVGPQESKFRVSVRENVSVAGKDTFKVCVLFPFTFYYLVKIRNFVVYSSSSTLSPVLFHEKLSVLYICEYLLL